MAIPQKIATTSVITVEDAEFTTYTSIKVELKQDYLHFSYTPTVLSDTQLSFKIPSDDAKYFSMAPVKWQVLCKDADGNNLYTVVDTVAVDEILGGEW